MIPNIFDFKKNPVSFVLGALLLNVLGIQLVFPAVVQHFPTTILELWEGKAWIVLVQSLFSYDWRQFLMVYMAVLFLGTPFERKIGSYHYLSIVLMSFVAVPQILNLVLEPIALGANAYLGMILILKMTGRYPKLSGESFKSSIFLFFILMLYLLYYGQHNQGVEAQIGHVQFLFGVMVAFFWRFGRIIIPKMFARRPIHKRKFYLAHLVNFIVLIIASSAVNASWDARWQINEMEKDVQAGDIQAAKLKFQEISDPDNPLTSWLLVYLQLKNNVRIQSMDEMVDILRENTQNQSQILLAEIFIGGYDPNYQSHDKAWSIIRTLPSEYPEVANLKAMLMCGSNNSAHLAPREALNLTRKLNQLTDWSDPALLDTHAACLARTEQWEEAQKWIIRAEKLQQTQDLTKNVHQMAYQEIIKNRDKILAKEPIVYGSEL